MPSRSRSAAVALCSLCLTSAAEAQRPVYDPLQFSQRLPGPGRLAAPSTEMAGSATLDLYRRAYEVWMRAIDASGGLASLRALEDVSVEVRGVRHLREQSRRPDPPYDTPAFEGSLLFDPRRGRLRWEEQSSFSAGFPYHTLIITDGQQRVEADLRQRTIAPGGNAALAEHHAILERLPHYILLDQLNRVGSLRWLGETIVGGVRHHVVAGAGPAPAPNRPPYVRTFYFDADAGLLSKFESVTWDSVRGDVIQETAFFGYRKVGPVMMPSRRTVQVAGEIIQDQRYVNARVNTRPEDSLFAHPSGLKEAAASQPQPQRMSAIAPGFHMLEDASPGYNMLVAEFADHLVVMEAPHTASITQTAIEAIKRAIPGKPIRYVVPTHHHSDHANGMRSFIAEGATIVTTPGNAAFFRRMGTTNDRTVNPDALSRAPRSPHIETFTGRRVFTDGTRTFEVRDIGPSPHAQEMLIAWIPSAKAVYQGDLLNPGPLNSLVAGNTSTRHFMQWLDRSGLDVRTVLGVHSPPRTREELRRAVEMMQIQR